MDPVDATDLCPGCFAAPAEDGPCLQCGFDPKARNPPTALPPGTSLTPGYIVGRVLGKPGGFGITYLALNRFLRTTVAIKEYLPRSLAARAAGADTIVPHSTDEGELFRKGLAQFLAEARAVAMMDHPNIVRVHSFFEANGTAYLVMDYYCGMTLAEHLEHQPDRRLRENLALNLIDPILGGLEAVHSKGFLHRDIKPGNIYLQARDAGVRPVLLDFGAARQAMGEGSVSLSVVLTESYAPLEQYHRNGKLGPWTDVYASAAVLYRMLTGHTPAPATERLHADAMNPAEVYGVSQRVSDAIRQAMQMDPRQRFQTVGDFQRALYPSPDCPASNTVAQDCLASDRVAQGRPAANQPPIRLTWLQWLSALLRRSCHVSAVLGDGESREPERPGNTVSPLTETSAPEVQCENPGDLITMFEPAHNFRQINQQSVACDDSKANTLGGKAFAGDSDMPDCTCLVPSSRLRAAHARESAANGAQLDHTRYLESGLSTDTSNRVAILVEDSEDFTQIRKQISVDRFPFSIGRADGVNLRLLDNTLSREHTEISVDGSKFFVKDLGSSNGTFINGCQIDGGSPAPLLIDDTIQLGRTSLRFVVDMPAIPDLSGLVLDDRYLLKQCLYRSIRAATYEAEDSYLPRSVAVKIFSSVLKRFTHDAEDFRRQAEAAAKLNHPNIGSVIDSGEGAIIIDGTAVSCPYICMPLLGGGSLFDVLEVDSAAPIDRVLTWIESLAGALDYMHDRNVIHGGIKPRCILFDGSGNPILTDFSMGRGRSKGLQTPLFGSPAFLAPEQWERQRPEPASDRYALAAIAYLLITGAPPYEGLENPKVRMRKFLRGPLPAHQEALGIRRITVPEAVSEVFAKALHHDSTRRYSSATVFSAALRDALSTARPYKTRVFISYRRESSRGWPTLFAGHLKQRGIQVFVDTQRVDQIGRFPERLRAEIRSCDVFVCLLGRSTLESDWVRQEIQLAHALSKPMIPVFQEDFDPGVQTTLSPHISAMLEFDAVHLFDFDEHLVAAAIESLTERIENTSSIGNGGSREGDTINSAD
jgi:serine/threonine protein kinase